MADRPATALTTGKVRGSYLHLWKPHRSDEAVGDDGKPKPETYNGNFCFPKTDVKTKAKFDAAIEAVKKTPKALKLWGGRVPSKLKLPLRDADSPDEADALEKNPHLKGMWFFNASAQVEYPPEIVDRDLSPIMDKKRIYSGVWVYLDLNLFAFGGKQNGVAAGISNVMFAKDDAPLGNASRPKDAFAEIQDDEETGADDVMG